MQSEVTITIRGDDSTFKKKFLCYDLLTVSNDCPELLRMIDQAKFEFKGDCEEVIVKITARWE